MNNSINTKKSEISQIQASLDSQDLAGVDKEATALSNNLKLMVNVLSREVLFSKLLVQLGGITPSNVILTNLSISQTEDAIDVTARATNYNAAAQLQANLDDPNNNIFSRTDIVTINCSDEDTEGIAASYPCAVTIRALFVGDNPFLFINTDEAS